MLTIEQLVPPPEPISQRAWECAYVLLQEFPSHLTAKQHTQATAIYQTPHTCLTWREIGNILRIYRSVVAYRV